MNGDLPDALDQLLGDWAASCRPDQEHTRRLSDQILSAAREGAGQVGSLSTSEPSPMADHSKTFVVRRAPTPDADWGAKLLVGGGLLGLLVLAGFVLYYSVSATSINNQRSTRSIAESNGNAPPATTNASRCPTAASLGATVLAAKRQLLTEVNALFDNQLVWIADGQREMSLEVREHAASGVAEFMLVRVVVAQRTSPDLPWSTVWQTDVISRNEAFVEVAPQQLDGSSFSLWTYRMFDGEVAVDMELKLDQQTQLQSSSSAVLRSGQPTRVACSSEDGVERCIFQTVMPLNPS